MRIHPFYKITATLAVAGLVLFFLFKQKGEKAEQLVQTDKEESPSVDTVAGADSKEDEEIDSLPRELNIVERQEKKPVRDKRAGNVVPDDAPKSIVRDAQLQNRLSVIPALPQRMIMTGKEYPFEIAVPAGWKILSWSDPVRAVINDRTIVSVETGPWSTSQDEFAKIMTKELMGRYPYIKLEANEVVEIADRNWNHMVFRGPLTGAGEDHEIAMVTYGSKRGSYTIVVEGDRMDMQEDAKDLELFVTSFRFPPDNFEPEDAAKVRVYVDGKRVDIE